MSLAVVIKSAEGLVIATESRVSVMGIINEPEGVNVIDSSFDNANKLFSFNKVNNIGVLTYGAASISYRTVESLIREFESGLPVNDKKIDVATFSKKISEFFIKKWHELYQNSQFQNNELDMNFAVAGYNEGELFGKLYTIEIPGKPDPQEQSSGIPFIIWWGGQREIVDRLVFGYDQGLINILIDNGIISFEQVQNIKVLLTPLQLSTKVELMPLQDCIELATFLIRTTIEAQRLSVDRRSCGGEIEVACITRDKPLQWIKQKSLTVK